MSGSHALINKGYLSNKLHYTPLSVLYYEWNECHSLSYMLRTTYEKKVLLGRSITIASLAMPFRLHPGKQY